MLRGVPELIGNPLAADRRQRLKDELSERALILAPIGRDAAVACGHARRSRAFGATICAGPRAAWSRELGLGAGFVLVTEEALMRSDLRGVRAWIDAQPEWSDLPFVLLTSRGGGLERNPAAERFLEVLGNVTFLERPFHPTTLVSVARSALRGRRRQYEARARLESLAASQRDLTRPTRPWRPGSRSAPASTNPRSPSSTRRRSSRRSAS